MSRQNDQRNPQPTNAPVSATTIVTGAPADANSNTTQVTLRLRGEQEDEHARPPERRIRWAEDVVNNENMGKKSSKTCCIYHKPREVGESSSEDSDSSSSSNDESDNDDGTARPPQRSKRHDPSRDCGHHHGHDPKKPSRKPRKSSPNAYEKQPKSVTEKTKQSS